MLTQQEFTRHLRDALNHLCDPEHLRQSALAQLFGVANRFDTFAVLQGILTEAIESMEPAGSGASQARSWRIYECLYYRYVQQLSPQEVAEQLGIGTRHLRREQRVAVDVLADRLWRRYGMGDVQEDVTTEIVQSTEPAGAAILARLGPDEVSHSDLGSGALDADIPSIHEELAWLKTVSPDSSTALDHALPVVLDMITPLADRRGVRLDTDVPDDLAHLRAHPVAINQLLLNLLSVAIHRAPGGEVHLSAHPEGDEVEIRVQGMGAGTSVPAMAEEDHASLDLARHLTELSGGRLDLSGQGQGLDVTLIVPAVKPIAVLVIDDNADTLQLLARYSAATRYRLVGTRDPEEAIGLAEGLSPQIIVLDVMMPQVDGWKVLGRLCHHPLTAHTPILVCTILAQEELALSLGASGFVRKPVTRQRFLAALSQVARQDQELR